MLRRDEIKRTGLLLAGLNKPSATWGGLSFLNSAAFLYLAADGRLHWDESSYLYAADYFSVGEILSGEFEPSGPEGQYLPAILHLLLVHGIVSLVGVGTTALSAVIIAYLLAPARPLHTRRLSAVETNRRQSARRHHS